MLSGNPNGNDVMVTAFRQYTINIPITADGNAFPKYSIYRGTGLLFGNAKNGRTLVKNVKTAIIPTLISSCVVVIEFTSYLLS